MFDDELYHYGMPRRSGRYPWGSGEDPYQHSGDFLTRVRELEKEGLTQTEIAKTLGLRNTTDLRAYKAIAIHEDKQRKIAAIKSMKSDGYTNAEIAEKLGLKRESTVRSMLKSDLEEHINAGRKTADFLRTQIDEKGIIDVSKGVELELGVSRTKLEEALTILDAEGYPIYNRGVPNVTQKGKQTITTLVCPPGTTYKDAYSQEVHTVADYVTYDDGESYHKGFIYPSSLDSKRIMIRHEEEGGIEKDGLIEIRRGVNDLSLGGSNYSQVRIMVDGTHYLKGMAVYSDGHDMPDGVDVIFNTNKSKSKPMMAFDENGKPTDRGVLKPVKDDPDNPFGSLIKEHGGQSFYDDPNGKYVDPVTGKRQSLSLINKRADEGDWNEWSKSLPSQFLGKQNLQLIDRQLGLAIADKQSEFDAINQLTNPAIKKKMLGDFADQCDKQAETLKAAALPRQRYQVILPVTSLNPNECFAPNYNDGETVALIRYPHAGPFEIPIVKVNNKNAEAQSTITKNAKDAIGINYKTAQQLSGADFDGDTVMVIPVPKNLKVNSREYLKGLKDFDPHAEYAERPGMKVMPKSQTGKHMGIVTNLITDMSLQGATDEEITRAVKHSMVVVDAAKHKLDYRRSFEENGIQALINKYQIHPDGKVGGATTLLSQATAKDYITHRVGSAKINDPSKPWYDPSRPNGSVIYKQEETKYLKKDKKTGKVKEKEVLDQVTRMSQTDDARTLISAANTPQEQAYAEFANALKNLANTARVSIINTPNQKYDKDAARMYEKEVAHLNAQLQSSMLNANRERAAQRLANENIKAKVAMDPSYENEKALYKKLKQQELTKARLKVGAKGVKIDITDAEYKAIQAGAITESKLNQILLKADPDRLRELATPSTKSKDLTASQKGLIKAMKNSGYTNAEIADRIGVSSTTVSKYL